MEQIADKYINCPKCGRKNIAKITEDGMVLVICGLRFYLETRFSCECHRAFKWMPVEPRDISSIRGYTQEILCNLGRGRDGWSAKKQSKDEE